jgi:foldase protein PrsA
MNLPRRYLAPLSAFFVLALVLSACGGNSVPGNAVASIGGDAIKKVAYDHWLKVAATTTAQQSGVTGAAAAVPDAPEFKQCIAAKKKTAPKPAKGQPTPTDATYKTQCETAYKTLRDQAVQFLISSAWIEGESADRNVKVSDTEAKKAFDTQRKQSFPTDAGYAAFLKSSGYTQEDLLYQIKIQTLSTKLRAQILKGTDKVSDAAIAAYYAKNKASFAQPEKRDLRIVLTKTEAEAEKALAALKDGQSWKSVAAKYSTDPSKSSGGVLAGVAKGQQEKTLDTATFAAKKGEIEGPLKTQFGYYVYEVTSITPGTQQSQADAKESIKQLLVSQQQQKALDTFLKDFEKKWKARTDCRKGYVVASCKNAPKTSTATTATTSSGSVTQNAAPASGSDATATTN